MFFLLAQNIFELAEESSDDTELTVTGVLLQYLEDSTPTVLNFLVKVIIIVIVLLVGRWLIRFVRKLLGKFLEKTGVEPGIRQFLDRALNVALWALLLLFILAQFGITASSVVAIIGSAGLSIGLALQGSLSNFAGGVLILMIKPFKVGDYIMDSNSNEGTVTEIRLFYTELNTIDNRVVIVPNGDLSNSCLTNYSRMAKRQVDLTIGISYHADVARAKEVLRQVAENESARLPDEPIQVFVRELSEDSVKMGFRVWVATPDYWEAKWRLTENIKYALDEHRIGIPFRQVTVSYDKSDSDKTL